MSNYILNKKTAGRCQSLSHEFATSGGYFFKHIFETKKKKQKTSKTKTSCSMFCKLGRFRSRAAFWTAGLARLITL